MPNGIVVTFAERNLNRSEEDSAFFETPYEIQAGYTLAPNAIIREGWQITNNNAETPNEFSFRLDDVGDRYIPPLGCQVLVYENVDRTRTVTREITETVTGDPEIVTKMATGLPINDPITPIVVQLQEGDTAEDLVNTVTIRASATNTVVNVSDIREGLDNAYKFWTNPNLNPDGWYIWKDAGRILIDWRFDDGTPADAGGNLVSFTYQVEQSTTTTITRTVTETITDPLSNDNLLFGGILTNRTMSNAGLIKSFECTALGWVHDLATTRIERVTYIARTYKEMIAARTSDGLNPPGVMFYPTLTADKLYGYNVDDIEDNIRFVLDNTAEWQGASVKQIIDELAKGGSTGFEWWIDADKTFHFRLPYRITHSGITFSEENDTLRVPEYAEDISTLSNDIMLISGGTFDAGTPITRPSEGEHTAFIVDDIRPLDGQNTPTFRRNTGTEAVPVWDDLTAQPDNGESFDDVTVDVLWDSRGRIIRTSPDKPLKDLLNSVEITGKRLIGSIKISTDEESIRRFGRWQSVVHDPSVIGTERINLRIKGALHTSSVSSFSLSFITDKPTKVGQVVSVDFPSIPSILTTDNFIVRSVVIKPLNSNTNIGLTYTVTLGRLSGDIGN